MCSVSGCSEEVFCLRMCRPHYRKFKRWGDPSYDVNSLEHKLRKLSQPDVGCWEWTGARNDRGYGQIWWGGSIIYVHRFMYERHVGPIPLGYEVDHLCSNPPCARPDHLEAVTPAENARRMWERGERSRITHCKWGHEFTPENTYRQRANGRGCRACRKIDGRNRYRRRKGIPLDAPVMTSRSHPA